MKQAMTAVAVLDEIIKEQYDRNLDENGGEQETLELRHSLLEKAKRRISALGEYSLHSGWIPVTERLPEEGQKTFASWNSLSQYTVGTFEIIRKEDCEFPVIRLPDGISYGIHNFNFWMIPPPLPPNL